MYPLSSAHLFLALLAFAVTLLLTALAAHARGRYRSQEEKDRIADLAYQQGRERGRTEARAEWKDQLLKN